MEPLPHPHSLQDLKAEYFSGSPGWPAHPSPPQPWLEAQSSILRHKPCSRAATQRWAAHTVIQAKPLWGGAWGPVGDFLPLLLLDRLPSALTHQG